MIKWQDKKVKGVIIAAGYGTRFLPATKTIPKEMLPIIDKPSIDFIIEEFIESGIVDILIVSSRRKKVMEDHLDKEKELEGIFSLEGKNEKLEKIAPPRANIFFTRQQDMFGTGHAIYQAKSFTEDNPFVVAYPDDIFFCKTKPLSEQLIDIFRKTGKSVLAIRDMGSEDITRYGVLKVDEKDGYYDVGAIVEKPAPGTEPSKFVSFGRYLFTPDFFDEVEPMVKAHKSGELYQTDPINNLAKKGKVIGLAYEGERFDTGAPFGFFQAIVRYGLQHKDLKDQVRGYIKSIAGEV